MDKRTYRAAPSAYAVSGAIAWALGGLWFAIARLSGAPWEPILVPLVAFVAAVVWLSRFRVSFGQDEILLAAPFLGARRCTRRDVLSVEFSEETGRWRGPMTLCIRLSSGEILRLNAKVFSNEAVQQLLALAPRTKSAA